MITVRSSPIIARRPDVRPVVKCMAVLTIVIAVQSLRAGTVTPALLEVQLPGCGETQGTVGPLSASCGPGQAFANYTHLGVMNSAGSASSGNTIAESFDTLTV